MGCIPLDTDESRIRELERRLVVFWEYARHHEAWEAAVLCDDTPWFDEMPEDLRGGFEHTQVLRNKAMSL